MPPSLLVMSLEYPEGLAIIPTDYHVLLVKLLGYLRGFFQIPLRPLGFLFLDVATVFEKLNNQMKVNEVAGPDSKPMKTSQWTALTHSGRWFFSIRHIRMKEFCRK